MRSRYGYHRRNKITGIKYSVTSDPSKFRVGANTILNFSPALIGYASECRSSCMNMSYCSLNASIRETAETNLWNHNLDRTGSFKNVSEKLARFVDQVKPLLLI